MSQTDRADTKTRIADALGGFLQRNRRILVVILIVIAVGIVAFFVYTQVSEARLESSTQAVENLQDDYDQWLNAEEEDSRDELRASILEDADEIVSAYPRYYAAARALFITASIHWEAEEYSQAVESYRRIADEHPNSHLAPVALYNASAGLEETGDSNGAMEALQQLLARYRQDDVPEIPRALFSLGRINEQESQFETAAQHYRDLVENYGNSSWTNLARDRIIWLITQGRIESDGGQS